jgi:hypothetical protein
VLITLTADTDNPGYPNVGQPYHLRFACKPLEVIPQFLVLLWWLWLHKMGTFSVLVSNLLVAGASVKKRLTRCESDLA